MELVKIISKIGEDNIKKGYDISNEDLHMAHVLFKYIEKAMSEAIYEKLDDIEYVGIIPSCYIIAFSPTLEECKDKLLFELGDWILIGLRLGQKLPVIGGIDLNELYNNNFE